MLYRGDDTRRLARLAAIAERACVPLIAVNDVLYHAPERRALQDVVTCIREHVTHRDGRPAARSQCRAASEIAAGNGAAVPPRAGGDRPRRCVSSTAANSRSRSCASTEYPDETRQGYATPQEALVALRRGGAEDGAIPTARRSKVRHALERGTAADRQAQICAVLPHRGRHRQIRALARGILCQGRGSAANSVICYCLGITEVIPSKVDLLFERFVSEERREPPDIDVDFEHERREEVIQHIYEKYGRERAGPRRHRDLLSRPQRHPRGRQGVRPVGGHHRARSPARCGAGRAAACRSKEARRAGLDPSDPRLQAGDGSWPRS